VAAKLKAPETISVLPPLRVNEASQKALRWKLYWQVKLADPARFLSAGSVKRLNEYSASSPGNGPCDDLFASRRLVGVVAERILAAAADQAV
jgi:hypothetical protein